MFREDLHGDVGPRRANSHGAIRRCTRDDIGWLRDLLPHTYGEQADLDRCELFYRHTLDRPDYIYLRGEQSAAAGRFYRPYWAKPSSVLLGEDVFFCAMPRKSALVELALVMREVVWWAKLSGAQQFIWTALNGANIRALAQRSGATEQVPMYRAVF